MSMGNATESDVLDFLLKGIDPAWRAAATGHYALAEGASIDEADPLANECDYTGYARVAATKATAFSGTGSTRTNAAQIQFGKRTDGGATQTAYWLIWCDTASGPVTMTVIGALDVELPISQNIRPLIEAGGATFTAD